MPVIENLQGLEILESRGNPTIMAHVRVNGIDTFAAVPSGASTGQHEAFEFRDEDKLRYKGKGVLNAVSNISEIRKAIGSQDILDQRAIDQIMIDLDGSKEKNKGRLGANAILAVSIAVCKAAATYKGIELFQHIADLYGNNNPNLLPTPMMNVINGGRHADFNKLRFQEFMIVPGGAPTFSEAVRWGSEVYQELKGVLDAKAVGDEGGFVPTSFKSRNGASRVREMLDLLVRGIEKAGYRPGLYGENTIALALDVAASEFYQDGEYRLSGNEASHSSDYMRKFYQKLIRDYPIVSIEDGFAEDDDVGWNLLGKHIVARDGVQIVDDDRCVTNVDRIQSGIDRHEANSVLIKLNQIGTVSETLDAISLVQRAGWNPVISHRSGETGDTTIVDLAVGTGAGQIKTGAPARSDRAEKYNRGIVIEEFILPDLGLVPHYAGWSPFRGILT